MLIFLLGLVQLRQSDQPCVPGNLCSWWRNCSLHGGTPGLLDLQKVLQAKKQRQRSRNLAHHQPICFLVTCSHTSNLSREPREYPCKFFLGGVNFYRFNVKIGNLLCKLAIYCVNFGVNFIFQKFCPCKKNDKYQVCHCMPFPRQI